MSVTPREKYGWGSSLKKFVKKVTSPVTKVAKKIVPKEIAGIMRVASPFLPPGYREAAYLLGTAKQTGRISPVDLALAAVPTFLEKTPMGQNLSNSFRGTKAGQFLVGGQKSVGLPIKGAAIDTKGILGSGGKMFKFGKGAGLSAFADQTKLGTFIDNNKLPLGAAAISGLAGYMTQQGMSDEQIEEVKQNPEALKTYLREYYSALNPKAKPEEVENFVQINTAEYRANGGRIGFQDGELARNIPEGIDANRYGTGGDLSLEIGYDDIGASIVPGGRSTLPPLEMIYPENAPIVEADWRRPDLKPLDDLEGLRDPFQPIMTPQAPTEIPESKMSDYDYSVITEPAKQIAKNIALKEIAKKGAAQTGILGGIFSSIPQIAALKGVYDLFKYQTNKPSAENVIYGTEDKTYGTDRLGFQQGSNPLYEKVQQYLSQPLPGTTATSTPAPAPAATSAATTQTLNPYGLTPEQLTKLTTMDPMYSSLPSKDIIYRQYGYDYKPDDLYNYQVGQATPEGYRKVEMDGDFIFEKEYMPLDSTIFNLKNPYTDPYEQGKAYSDYLIGFGGDPYYTPTNFNNGGRAQYGEGTTEMGMIDPKKVKQAQTMIKMGADVSTISSITGLTEAQVNQIQQTQGKADGGRMGYGMGSLVSKFVKENPEIFKPVSQSKKVLSPSINGTGGMLAKFVKNNPEIFMNLNSEEDEEDRNMVAYGGRMGYAYGNKPEDNAIQASGIEGLPLNQNPAGITELDLRDSGGFIPPVGVKEKADDIPAMLSNNEFVFTADAVRGMGDGNVNKGAQRMYDMMKKLENGGRV
jgi:hypothetical protein